MPERNISEEYKFVLWCPPRCGTRYTYQAMTQLGLRGPARNGRTGMTHRMVPPPSDDYAALVVVRNPYTRMLSGWAWLRQAGAIPYDCPFDSFVGSRNRLLLRPVVRLLKNLTARVDFKLHLETLSADIMSLPFVDKQIKFPPNRFSSDYHEENKPWQEWYTTQRTIDLVRMTYNGDFAFGGYDVDF